jgi:outer membrane protein assembly factor BamD (BamD/ComL family)
LLALVFLSAPWGCQRRTPARVAAPPPPPPPNYYQIGETAFEAGEYTRAIDAYSTYLRTSPGGLYTDRVLFQMAMAYSLPESSVHNPARAAALLDELIRDHPTSSYRPPATLLVRQQAELREKQAELDAQQVEMERLLADLSVRELEIQNLTQELERVRKVEMEEVRAEVTRREARIRQLTEELDRLKQIDLRRRPATPLP